MIIPGAGVCVDRQIRYHEHLPDGKYTLAIIEVERIARERRMIAEGGIPQTFVFDLTFSVVTGPYGGNRFNMQIAFKHSSEIFKATGQLVYCQILQAMGKKSVLSPKDLIGIWFDADVAVVPSQNGFPATNEIKRRYKNE